MPGKKTPLHEEHKRLNAQTGEFAGWDMPIHYGSIIEEARYTRSRVSLFDISHMGELYVREDPENSSLDRLITVPVTRMETGKCRYGFLLNDDGGILDDLIVYRLSEDEWMIVVNASNEENDAGIFKKGLSGRAAFKNMSDEIVKIDVQGPGSHGLLREIVDDKILNLGYYSFKRFNTPRGEGIISRTGYTGELGYEIYIDADKGIELWNTLLGSGEAKPAGLGARDILRTEMGYPLYGHELSEKTTPIEAGLERFLDPETGYTGKEALYVQKSRGFRRKIAGFKTGSRRAPRPGNTILVKGSESGQVTSGVFSPHLNMGIGIGYIDIEYDSPGTEIEIDTGRGGLKADICEMPFIGNTSLLSK